MESVTFERRRLRSPNLARAMELLLAAVGEAFNLSHAVVADHSGLMQASWGDPDDGHALAAYAPMLHRTMDPLIRERIIETLAQYIPRADSSRIAIRHFTCGGESLYVCVLGDPGASKDVALCRALSGARRILAQASW